MKVTAKLRHAPRIRCPVFDNQYHLLTSTHYNFVVLPVEVQFLQRLVHTLSLRRIHQRSREHQILHNPPAIVIPRLSLPIRIV
jgi:hypothetical protein